VKRQLAALEAMGLRRAIVAIEHSIAHNWRGIYEPSGHAPPPQVPGASAPAADEAARLAEVIKHQSRQAAQLAAEEQRLLRERENEPAGSFLFGGRDHVRAGNPSTGEQGS
jgi:hypothetical protein